MVLDEALYNPTLPIGERGKDAWIRLEDPSPALGKRMRDAQQPQPLNPNRRKLRRAASTRIGFQGDALWAEITTQNLDQDNKHEDEWKDDTLFNYTAPQEELSAVAHQEATASQNEIRNAHVPSPAPADIPQVQDVEQDQGIFQGHIVVTHGFDQDKVRCDIGVQQSG